MSGPELWSDSDNQDESDLHEPEVKSTEASSVLVFSLFLILWQSVFKVSNIAVTVLLRFLSLFFHHLANITQLESFKMLTDTFPDTLLKAQRVARLNRDDFIKYVCCPKCFAIYNMEDCFDEVGTQRILRLCCSARFPRHPWRSMRGVCSSTLLKTIKMSRKEMYKPISVLL